ncbi:hypothetical protein PFWH6_0606 [Pseudomonas fluorescens WH6]|nr:hypothetical protein PFWH6_0606 [Pseudomonas fluorescens WH6]
MHLLSLVAGGDTSKCYRRSPYAPDVGANPALSSTI